MTTNIICQPIPNSIVSDFVLSSGYELESSKKLFGEVAKFLLVASRSDVALAPSPAVDAAWHDFILHTRDYDRYCRTAFGFFVHHAPIRGVTDPNRYRYLATLAALREVFGEPDPFFWPSHEAFLNEVCDSDCSGDSGGGGGDR